MEQILEIKDLHVEYKTERARVYALNGLDLAIHKSEPLGLVGESGAGKTTTALSILRLLAPGVGKVTGGEICYHGKPMDTFSEDEMIRLRGGKISMIFQNPLTSLNPVFTVGEQIAMVLRKHMGMGRRQALEKAGELLDTVGIPANRIKDYPSQFSGGMRQRVGIAAGLACNPEILIADEPTTALDVTIQAQILELMKRLQAQYDTSLLMITHNLGIIAELCEKVAVMYGGRVIEYGDVKSVFKSPAHPYTEGLLGSIPKLTGERRRLVAIPGSVADAQRKPEGCSFRPRCALNKSRCGEGQPPMIKLSDTHYVACYQCSGGN